MEYKELVGEDGMNGKQRQEFFKMCEEIIDNKVEQFSEETDKVDKVFGKEIKKLREKELDKFKKECQHAADKFKKEWMTKLNKLSLAKGKDTDSVFDCSFDVESDIEDWYCQEVDDEDEDDYSEETQKKIDAYEKKLRNKLFEIKQELFFGNLPKIKKMFEELKAM